MSNARHLEWLNSNSNRSYPLKNSDSQLDTNGSFSFPNELILDAIFTVEDISQKIYVGSLNLYGDGIIIKFYDYSTEDFIASMHINKASHSIYDSYVITGNGDYKNVCGKIVIGDIDQIDDSAIGTFLYEKDATVFHDTVILPAIRGVTSLSTDSSSEKLIGNIKLLAGYNVRLRVDTQNNAIYIDAIEGEGLGVECPCEETENREPIYTINKIRPDASGNFNISGVRCIEFEPTSNGLIAKNTCESICCDCDDVNAILAAVAANKALMEELDSRIATLEAC